MARRLERGDVCLHRFDPPDKQRPVVVVTRSQSISRLSRITVIPITSTIRGVPSEVFLDESDGMKAACVANVHNILTVGKQEIGKRLTKLSSERMRAICSALEFALGCRAQEPAETSHLI
ncbi:MAG: type II toxin-antitoxin system PemK/MazF family toxin [Bryobacterales bacterium]|nr:type II toxin-antitoxin system PemK/MazF family toxin [Bryobacterales bacterium]